MIKGLSTKKSIVFIINLFIIAIALHPSIGETTVKTAKITLETCATGEQQITFYNGRLFWSVEGFWNGEKDDKDKDVYIAVRPGEGSECHEITSSYITVDNGEKIEIPTNEITFPESGDERHNFIKRLAKADSSIEDGWIKLGDREGWLLNYYWHIHWEGTFDLSKLGIKGLKKLIDINDFQYLRSDLTAGIRIMALPTGKAFLGMSSYITYPTVYFYKPGHESAFFKLEFNIEYETDEK